MNKITKENKKILIRVIVVVIISAAMFIYVGVVKRYTTVSLEYATVEKTYRKVSSRAILNPNTSYIVVARSEDGTKKVNLVMPRDDWVMANEGDTLPVTVFRLPRTTVDCVMYGHVSIDYVYLFNILQSPYYE